MYQNIQVHTKMFIDVPYHTRYKYKPVHTSTYQNILVHTRTYQYIPGLIWVPKRCKPLVNLQSSACYWHAFLLRWKRTQTKYLICNSLFFGVLTPIFLFLPVYLRLALDDWSTESVLLCPSLQPSRLPPGSGLAIRVPASWQAWACQMCRLEALLLRNTGPQLERWLLWGFECSGHRQNKVTWTLWPWSPTVGWVQVMFNSLSGSFPNAGNSVGQYQCQCLGQGPTGVTMCDFHTLTMCDFFTSRERGISLGRHHN
jgi:hypothetical protein